MLKFLKIVFHCSPLINMSINKALFYSNFLFNNSELLPVLCHLNLNYIIYSERPKRTYYMTETVLAKVDIYYPFLQEPHCLSGEINSLQGTIINVIRAKIKICKNMLMKGWWGRNDWLGSQETFRENETFLT